MYVRPPSLRSVYVFLFQEREPPWHAFAYPLGEVVCKTAQRLRLGIGWECELFEVRDEEGVSERLAGVSSPQVPEDEEHRPRKDEDNREFRYPRPASAFQISVDDAGYGACSTEGESEDLHDYGRRDEYPAEVSEAGTRVDLSLTPLDDTRWTAQQR
jgi:hypothetical protein